MIIIKIFIQIFIHISSIMSIKYIMGKGMIYALIFDNQLLNVGKKLKQICFGAMQNGLLVVYTGRESIKIGPPLTISKNAIKEGLQVLDEQISKVFRK